MESNLAGDPDARMCLTQLRHGGNLSTIATEAPAQQAMIIRIRQRVDEGSGIRGGIGKGGGEDSPNAAEAFPVAQIYFIPAVEFEDFHSFFSFDAGPA